MVFNIFNKKIDMINSTKIWCEFSSLKDLTHAICVLNDLDN